MACPSVRTSFSRGQQVVPDPRVIFYNTESMQEAMGSFELHVLPAIAAQCQAAVGSAANQAATLAMLDRLNVLNRRNGKAPRNINAADKAKEISDRLRSFTVSLHKRDYGADREVEELLTKFPTAVEKVRQQTQSNVVVKFSINKSVASSIKMADVAALAPMQPLTRRIINLIMLLGNLREVGIYIYILSVYYIHIYLMSHLTTLTYSHHPLFLLRPGLYPQACAGAEPPMDEIHVAFYGVHGEPH